MTEIPLSSKSLSGLTFRASGKVSKRHYMPKVVSHRLTVPDGFNKRFKSSLSIFVPKLNPDYVKPQVFFHISNGASSCLVRCRDPNELIRYLEDLIATLRSPKWEDAWFRLETLSENLITSNELKLDEELVDINAWEKSLENTIDVNLVQVNNEGEELPV